MLEDWMIWFWEVIWVDFFIGFGIVLDLVLDKWFFIELDIMWCIKGFFIGGGNDWIFGCEECDILFFVV